MRLDYGTQISPSPIKLSIGTLRKPKLVDVSDLGFEKLSVFELFAKMTPETYFIKIKEDTGKAYWESLTDEQRDKMTMFYLIATDESLQELYTDMFNFFFVEPVVFQEGVFIVFKNDTDFNSELSVNDIRGVIYEDTFSQVLTLIQQICCIYEEEQSIDELKFKNKTARKLYEKMLKAQKQEKKKSDLNLTLPNIISAVSNSHPSVNPINIWDMTIYQLIDSFDRLQANKMYDIDQRRVSVWGDEKKTFDPTLWYKNNYDKK